MMMEISSLKVGRYPVVGVVGPSPNKTGGDEVPSRDKRGGGFRYPPTLVLNLRRELLSPK
jgi:hypothetical protein